MADESPELIASAMADTRQSLTDKVAALEQQVTDTIGTTTAAVQDTVATIQTAVQDSVNSVSAAVKETFDLTRHVRENPWAMVGGAAVAGLVTGLLAFGRRTPAAPVAAFAARVQAQAAPTRSGMFDDLLDLLGQKVKELGQTAISNLTTAVQDGLAERIPQVVDNVMPKPRPPEPVPHNGYAHAERF